MPPCRVISPSRTTRPAPQPRRELENTLTALGKRARMYIYPGTQHAFFNDDRPEVYDTTAAREAWEKLLPFLRDELR